MSLKFSPLNALPLSKATHVMPTQYTNVVITSLDVYYCVHLYFPAENKWEKFSTDSKTLLQPYLHKTIQQVSEDNRVKDMDGVIYCYRGGKIGTSVRKSPKSGACLVPAEQVGIEPASVKLGTKDDFDKGKGLMVEFLKYQRPSTHKKPLYPCLAIHSQE